MKRKPEHFKSYGEDIMSNFDREIDTAVEEAIKGKELYPHYPGWDFYSNIRRKDDQWHCEVWTYGSLRETISAATLEEIMKEVSDIYGYE